MTEMIGTLLPMGAVVIIFYFLMIRPQQKQKKLLEQKINNIKKGDKFLTSGGIYCSVIGVKDNIVTGKISEDVKIEVNKAYITNVIYKDEEEA